MIWVILEAFPFRYERTHRGLALSIMSGTGVNKGYLPWLRLIERKPGASGPNRLPPFISFSMICSQSNTPQATFQKRPLIESVAPCTELDVHGACLEINLRHKTRKKKWAVTICLEIPHTRYPLFLRLFSFNLPRVALSALARRRRRSRSCPWRAIMAAMEKSVPHGRRV